MKKSDFDKYQVFEKFRAVKEHLQCGVENEEYSETIKASIQEALDKVKHVEWVVKSSENTLLSEFRLNHLARTLDSIISSSLTQTVNQNGRLIDRVNSNITSNSETLITTFPFPIAKKYFKSEAAKAVAELNELIGKMLFDSKNNTLEVIDNIEDKKDKFFKDIGEKNAELESALNDIKNKLTSRDKEIEDLRQKLSDSTASINAAAEEKASQFDVLIDQRKQQLKDWGEETKSRGNDLLKKIEDIYKMSANLEISGEFVTVAKKENTVYWI